MHRYGSAAGRAEICKTIIFRVDKRRKLARTRGVHAIDRSTAKIFTRPRYKDSVGNQYPLRLKVIAEDGRRTHQMHNFCHRHRSLKLPLKGTTDRQSVPLRYTVVRRVPGTNRSAPEDLIRIKVDVDYYKAKLAGKLEVAPSHSGEWRLYNCREIGNGCARPI